MNQNEGMHCLLTPQCNRKKKQKQKQKTCWLSNKRQCFILCWVVIKHSFILFRDSCLIFIHTYYHFSVIIRISFFLKLSDLYYIIFIFSGDGYLYYLFNRWLWKLWLTSRINLTYYALLGSVLYITFGKIGILIGFCLHLNWSIQTQKKILQNVMLINCGS